MKAYLNVEWRGGYGTAYTFKEGRCVAMVDGLKFLGNMDQGPLCASDTKFEPDIVIYKSKSGLSIEGGEYYDDVLKASPLKFFRIDYRNIEYADDGDGLCLYNRCTELAYSSVHFRKLKKECFNKDIMVLHEYWGRWEVEVVKAAKFHKLIVMPCSWKNINFKVVSTRCKTIDGNKHFKVGNIWIEISNVTEKVEDNSELFQYLRDHGF